MQPRSDSKIRVVVADDHPVVREGIVAIIDRERDMSVVAQAADGRAAVEAVLKHAPDVILMDLRMPVMDGLEAIRILSKTMPSSRIIVLTTYDGDEDIHRAIRSGAMGYLLKDLYRDELLDAIRSVAAGRRTVPAKVAVRLAEHLASSELTQREMAILRLIVEGRSNKEIAEALSIAEGTVKGHVKNVFSKLAVSDRTQAATAALRRGFVRFDELTPS
jgi:two-component system NarL family response regulator